MYRGWNVLVGILCFCGPAQKPVLNEWRKEVQTSGWYHKQVLYMFSNGYKVVGRHVGPGRSVKVGKSIILQQQWPVY